MPNKCVVSVDFNYKEHSGRCVLYTMLDVGIGMPEAVLDFNPKRGLKRLGN